MALHRRTEEIAESRVAVSVPKLDPKIKFMGSVVVEVLTSGDWLNKLLHETVKDGDCEQESDNLHLMHVILQALVESGRDAENADLNSPEVHRIASQNVLLGAMMAFPVSNLVGKLKVTNPTIRAFDRAVQKLWMERTGQSSLHTVSPLVEADGIPDNLRQLLKLAGRDVETF